jgi:hypothetical protein
MRRIGQRLVFWFLDNRNGLTQVELNELCMIVWQALDSYNFIVGSEGAVQQALSTHELEIVRWAVQGKTSIEIGH